MVWRGATTFRVAIILDVNPGQAAAANYLHRAIRAGWRNPFGKRGQKIKPQFSTKILAISGVVSILGIGQWGPGDGVRVPGPRRQSLRTATRPLRAGLRRNGVGVFFDIKFGSGTSGLGSRVRGAGSGRSCPDIPADGHTPYHFGEQLKTPCGGTRPTGASPPTTPGSRMARRKLLWFNRLLEGR